MKRHNMKETSPVSPFYMIGVISDTHGLLRPEAINVLKNSDAIIHAGDIGSAEILAHLRSMCPTYAVRGNIDWEPYAQKLPGYEVIQLGGKFIYVTHSFSSLDLDPKGAGFDAVVFGHTHQPEIFSKDGVLYLNPGSAGPARFSKPVSMARMIIDNEIEAEIIQKPDDKFTLSFMDQTKRRCKATRITYRQAQAKEAL